MTATPPGGVRPEFIYLKNTGTKTETNFCSQLFSIDNDNRCPITYCNIEKSDDGGLTFYDFSESYKPTLNSGNYLTADMVTPTSLPQRNTLYIKAWTKAGQFARQEFFLEVCGLEIHTTTVPDWTHIYALDNVHTEIEHEFKYKAMFANDDPVHCPTTSWTIQDSVDNGTTFRDYTGDRYYLQDPSSDNARLVTKVD